MKKENSKLINTTLDQISSLHYYWKKTNKMTSGKSNQKNPECEIFHRTVPSTRKEGKGKWRTGPINCSEI